MDLNKKLEGLKKQQEQAKELYIKLQGAIEFTQSLIDEEKKNED
jgi:predicted transcriptional regulator